MAFVKNFNPEEEQTAPLTKPTLGGSSVSSTGDTGMPTASRVAQSTTGNNWTPMKTLPMPTTGVNPTEPAKPVVSNPQNPGGQWWDNPTPAPVAPAPVPTPEPAPTPISQSEYYWDWILKHPEYVTHDQNNSTNTAYQQALSRLANGGI